MEGQSVEKNKKKYIWLHRTHVTVLLFFIIRVAAKVVYIPEIDVVSFSAVAVFLVYSLFFNSRFLFTAKFYKLNFWTFLLTLPLHSSWFHPDMYGFFGDLTFLIIFILFSSMFVLAKVFELEGKDFL